MGIEILYTPVFILLTRAQISLIYMYTLCTIEGHEGITFVLQLVYR